MQKAESLSFPTVIGSGGRGQSLHGEILVGAKGAIALAVLTLFAAAALMRCKRLLIVVARLVLMSTAHICCS